MADINSRRALLERKRDLLLQRKAALASKAAPAAGGNEQPASPAMAFLNKGIANTLGAPVDIASAALGLVGLESDEPVGGSKNIASMMRTIGAGPREGEQASGLGARVAQGVGEAAGSLMPVGLAAKAASSLPGIAGAIGGALNSTIASKPVAATALDLASGAGSGVGGTVAELAAPGNMAAQTAGEVAGGIAVPLSIASLVNPVKMGVRAAKSAIFPYTDTGAKIRAADRVKSLVPDPEAAAKSLDQETIVPLSPAQKTGDERMLALENAVRDADVNMDEKFRNASKANIETLKGEVNKIRGEGNVADAQDQFASRQEKLNTLLDTRLQQATDKADQALAKVAPGMRESQASVIARNELESALSDARTQEKVLWNEIPGNILVEKNNTTDAYKRLLKDTPRAQSDDIPKRLMGKFFRQPAEKLVRLYNARGEEMLGDKVPVTEKITELQGLRSKLLEESRKARADGNYNKARIHDDLAESVLEDIGAASGRVQGEIGQKIRDALDFSRTLNDKFTRGEVGKVLGTAKTGGDKVAAELTLNNLVGSGKVKGGVGLKQMLEAADTPELRGSVEDYVKEQLNKVAIKNGKVNPAAARKFAEENSDILEKFPELKKSILDTSSSADNLLAKSARTTQAKKALSSENKNAVSKFINAPIDKEFDVILASRDPAGFTKELVQRAAKDKTGAAAKGLKASAVDYLMRKSIKEGSLSGQDLLSNLNDNPRINKALQEVLNPQELQRLRRIGGELKAVQMKTGKDIGGIINDTPATIIQTPIRVFAARMGAKFGRGTDGASLLTANLFSQRAKKFVGNLTNDKAREMLIMAVDDDKLMKALMTDMTTKPGQKMAAQRLEAWLLGPGSNLLEDDDKKNQ
ncbi:MAG: hypothetical protein V4721_00415 [Bacteroidota bacterium]